jgi:hypothetical protein
VKGGSYMVLAQHKEGVNYYYYIDAQYYHNIIYVSIVTVTQALDAMNSQMIKTIDHEIP